jgi:uncharacterized protein YutE (UPF0331/DUF86 family)
VTPPRVDLLSVQAKLRLLHELIEDLDAVGEVDEARLRRERLTLRAVERILTQVVEITASIASHVAAASLQLPATSYRGAFQDAATVGLIDPALAASLSAAAGMRNVLVHEYVRTDLTLVAAAVPRARADCDEFIRQVSGWLTRHS